jgi:glycosyltransferase involved in cell wall biosynthesis
MSNRTQLAHGEGVGPELSIVIPVYGCATCLVRLHNRLNQALAGICDGWEIIFVDDRSPDNSWETLKSLAEADARVIAVRLSRNFGQQIAISAGIEKARGKMIVVMDCDLQDPPEFIPALVSEFRNGAEIVLAQRESAYQSSLRRSANRFYFWLLGLLSGTKIDGKFGSFSLISRKVADAYSRFVEIDRHYLFIIFWLGFDVRVVPYKRESRTESASAYSYGDLLRLAISGIFFQTTRLMRWVVQFGFVIALIGLLYGLYLSLGVLLFERQPPQGWTSVIVLMLFMSGVIIVSIGIVGLYVARIFEQTKLRPLYVVDEELRVSESSSIAGNARQTEIRTAL